MFRIAILFISLLAFSGCGIAETDNVTHKADKDELANHIRVDLNAMGPILKTPAPVKPETACTGCPTKTAATLGELASQQGGKVGCDEPLQMNLAWAKRLPKEFPIYAGAKVKEAAGREKGQCAMRIVTFTTPAPLSKVMDHYYTRAIRTGYSGEHQLDGKDHVLGGVRSHDDGAYYMIFRTLKKGGTEVDMITNKGV